MEAGVAGTVEPLALDQIQGNIVGFNKPLQSFIALHFDDSAKGRDFVHAVLREVDTCAAVSAFNRRYKWHVKRGKTPPTSEWFNLLFSAKGLEAVGAPELEQFEAVFREGMRARAGELGDTDKSDPGGWIEPFQAEIHAVAILAADTPEGLAHWQERVGHHAHANHVSLLGRIDGKVREGEAHGREHFGFKDGVSQPGIVGLTEEAKPGQQLLPAGEFILGLPRLGEAEAPRPVGYEPAPPPPRPPFPSWAVNGSYAVLRQLRQDVGAFRAFLSENASATGGDENLLGAKLVGRYKNGAPLEMTRAEAEAHAGEEFLPPPEEARADEAVANDFGYLPQDAGGNLVPRGAHIRKVFPRDEEPPGPARGRTPPDPQTRDPLRPGFPGRRRVRRNGAFVG